MHFLRNPTILPQAISVAFHAETLQNCTMRAWHIFALGTIVVVAGVLLPFYHASLAACGAIVIVGVVAFGFIVHPRRSVFYLRTTISRRDSEGNTHVEHDQIAVKVELTRLWILFIPTFLAVAFLSLTWAQGTTLKFNLLDALAGNSLALALFWRIGIAVLLVLNAILSAWISERWTLRDATACSARSISIKARGITYAFTDERGEFYGGEAVVVSWPSPAQVATIVVYRTSKPDLNKIAAGCLFHRFVIIGHGLTDLDRETVQGRLRAAQITT